MDETSWMRKNTFGLDIPPTARILSDWMKQYASYGEANQISLLDGIKSGYWTEYYRNIPTANQTTRLDGIIKENQQTIVKIKLLDWME